jgi:hypothetical protein
MPGRGARQTYVKPARIDVCSGRAGYRLRDSNVSSLSDAFDVDTAWAIGVGVIAAYAISRGGRRPARERAPSWSISTTTAADAIAAPIALQRIVAASVSSTFVLNF